MDAHVVVIVCAAVNVILNGVMYMRKRRNLYVACGITWLVVIGLQIIAMTMKR